MTTRKERIAAAREAAENAQRSADELVALVESLTERNREHVDTLLAAAAEVADKRTYVLYGVAHDRGYADPEYVCMFFATPDEREDFRTELPGDYQVMVLTGVTPDDFEVET